MRIDCRLLAVLVVLSACGGDGNGGGTPDAAVVVGPDARRGDGNDSLAEAAPIAFGTVGASGVIESPGDRDYFQFTATAGQWFLISTVGNGSPLDTVIRLHGPGSTTAIAENTEGLPLVSADSELIFRAQAAGAYYVEVLDYQVWSGYVPAFGPAHTYSVQVRDATTLPTSVIEPATDPGETAEPVTVTVAQVLMGKFDSSTDTRERYSITVDAPTAIIVLGMPGGPTGNGSTASNVANDNGPCIGAVLVTNALGTSVAVRSANVLGAARSKFDLPAAGTYTFSIGRPSGAAGANDFWVAKVLLGVPGDHNDVFGEAVSLTLGVDAPVPPAAIQEEGDRDFYKIAATMGQRMQFTTQAKSLVPQSPLDTVLRVYGPDTTTVLGQNDDVMSGNTDSQVILQIPATGDYYLEVLEFGDWSQMGARGGETYLYTVRAVVVVP